MSPAFLTIDCVLHQSIKLLLSFNSRIRTANKARRLINTPTIPPRYRIQFTFAFLGFGVSKSANYNTHSMRNAIVTRQQRAHNAAYSMRPARDTLRDIHRRRRLTQSDRRNSARLSGRNLSAAHQLPSSTSCCKQLCVRRCVTPCRPYHVVGTAFCVV